MATTVPYTGELSVAPTDQPIPSRSGEAPLSAFGGASAAALEGLGKQAQHSGTELWDRAIAMQQLNEQADAVNKISDLADKQTDHYMQFRSLQGKAAVDGFPEFKEKMNSIREEVGATLNSDYARKLYLQESRASQTRIMFSAAAHAGDQQKHYLIGTSEARINSAASTASAASESDDVYKASLDTIRTESKQLASIQGWSQEQEDDYVRTKTSDTVYDRVTSLARSKPVAAQKVLDEAISAGNIEGDKAARAGSQIRTQKINVTSRIEAANLISGESGALGKDKVPISMLREAVGGIESSGSYNPPTVPDTTNKQGQTGHPVGRYGIMSYNLPIWLKEFNMPAMTEQQFLNDHKAQDQLAELKLEQYQEKYGSANEALKRWRGYGIDPVFGETEERYLQKGNAQLVRLSSGSQLRDVAEAHAEKVSPGDPEFKEALGQRTLAMHRQNQQIEKEDEFNRQQIVSDALAPKADGKLVTSLDEFSPEAQDAFASMNPTNQARVRKGLAQNAKGDYAETPENQNSYRTWIGKIIDPQRSPETTDEIIKHDFANESMPWAQRKQLMDMQGKVFKGTMQAPNLGHALQVLAPMMQNAGIERKNKDDFAQFQGALHLIMEQRIQDGGKKLDDEEIKTIGAGLIRQQSYPGSIFGNLWPSKDAVYRMPMPEKDRNEITNGFLSDQNREPTETEIQSIFAAKQFNQFYSKAKTTEASMVPISR